jgi:LysR family glycine cleavage system transcriptional activator
VGGPDLNVAAAIKYESSALTYAAAVAGLGVALGERSLVAEDIRAGALVMPLDNSLLGQDGYFLIYPRHLRATPGIAEFTKWILKEAEGPI